MTPNRTLVVPAAGRGARLGAGLPKVLVPINGRPMLQHLLTLHAPFVTRAIVVAAPGAIEPVRACARTIDIDADVVEQAEPTGMLDAILIGVAAARERAPDRLWITWGDQVGVQAETLARLASVEGESDVALATVAREQPYIHVARDGQGRITSVLQRREGDAMPDRGESDMGLFSLSAPAAFDWLLDYARDVQPGAGTGERNFVPFVAWAAARGRVVTCEPLDPMEAVGVNTPEELDALARWMRSR